VLALRGHEAIEFGDDDRGGNVDLTDPVV